MSILKLSILLVCFYSLGDKTVSAGLTSYEPLESHSFLAQLIKIFSSCEPQYKLTYFGIRGRAEWIRLIFAACGQSYIDNRVNQSDWPSLKPNTPFGQLPTLEILDGNKVVYYAESHAIANYLAKKCCLIPRDDIQAGYADMYAHYFSEMFDLISSYYFETDAQLKQSKYNTLATVTWPLFLSRVEARIIANNGCGVIAGYDVSYVDLYLVSILDFYKTLFGGNLDAYPNVKALDARVRALPKVAAWLATRPATTF